MGFRVSNATGVQASRILIANDQEWSARSLESILTHENYEVVRAYSGAQALERARAQCPDAILLDQQMTDLGGLDVCRTLRADGIVGPTVPILITTAGPASRANRLEALAVGAWDFITQPVDGEALLLRLRNFMAAKAVTDRLRHDRLTDETTGLYNTRGLARRGREAAADAARRSGPLSCVVVSPGLSPSADSPEDESASERDLSIHVAKLIQQTARAGDVVGQLAPLRFGVLASTGGSGARRLLARYRETIGAHPFPPRDGRGKPAAVTLRAGVCVVEGLLVGEADPLEMFRKAAIDLALPEHQN